MPLVKAVCTNCGAPLDVDNTKDAAICPYCSTPYIVEKAINRYVTNIQNLNAGVVNLINEDKAKQLFSNAEAQLMLGEFDAAYNSYKELSVSYANDARSWSGLLGAISHNKELIVFSVKEVDEISRYYANLKKLDRSEAEKWEAYYNEVNSELKSSLDMIDSLTKRKNSLENDIVNYKRSAIAVLIFTVILIMVLDTSYEFLYNDNSRLGTVLFALHIVLIVVCVCADVYLFYRKGKVTRQHAAVESKISALFASL